MTASVDPRLGAHLGLYLHVPFCLRKCLYCSFFSVVADREQVRRYCQAVLRQAAGLRGRAIGTVFFGGGTPSILPVEDLALLLQECRRNYSSADEEIETSIEVNPATVDGPGLLQLRRAGFNRLSVGVQSLDDHELRMLGRSHTAAEALEVIAAARRAGFANLNLDLIYGLPGQTASSWRQTLRAGLDLAPEHLALYELTIEENTTFAARLAQGRLTLPHEEEVLAMMAITEEETNQAGIPRYEISNYARPGRECRHNLNYWHNGEYLGFGAGAVACLEGRRCAAVQDVDRYCRLIEAGLDPWDTIEELDTEDRFRETVIMGLRLTAGVSLSGLARRFGVDPVAYYGDTLQRLIDQGLLLGDNDRLRLTGQGLTLANQVMAELV